MKFLSFEIQGVKELDQECMIVEDDGDADFFSIYGRCEGGLAYCIGDFSSREGAETIKAAIESGR